MRTTIEDWKNGWFGVELAIAPDEIDELIGLLQMLKVESDQHFHISSDYRGSGGVGTITISMQPASQGGNASLSSRALRPGDNV